MSVLARTLLPFLLVTVSLGCDSSSVLDACVDDPEAPPGSRSESCRASSFEAEDRRAREVVGIVRRGEDVVPGATVRIDPASPAGAGGGRPVSTVSDAVGFFGLRPIALRYDLSAKLGEDLLFYRGVAGRWLDPSIEGPRTLARSYTGRVDLRPEQAIPPGHSLAFFVSGDGIVSISGDLATGLSVVQRTYTSRATIHVLEHETGAGFDTTVAYGRTDVVLDAGSLRSATVALEPIALFAEPRFTVSAPPGFTPEAVDVIFGFLRTSDGVLASVPVGASKRLPVIPNAGVTYRCRATHDGAVSDTGENGLDMLRPVTEIELPSPPTAGAPLDGETRAPGETLIVDGEGLFEHVFDPVGGGRTIRIVTRQRAVTMPDATTIGASAATGPHTWTVRNFPTARFPEELAGLDARRFRPMSASKPRTIVLR